MIAGLNGTLPTGGDGARHYRIQAGSAGHARFKRVRVEVSEHNGSLMPNLAFLIADVMRQFNAPRHLLIVSRMQFASEMDANQQKVRPSRQIEMPYRHPLRAKDRAQMLSHAPPKKNTKPAGAQVGAQAGFGGQI